MNKFLSTDEYCTRQSSPSDSQHQISAKLSTSTAINIQIINNQIWLEHNSIKNKNTKIQSFNNYMLQHLIADSQNSSKINNGHAEQQQNRYHIKCQSCGSGYSSITNIRQNGNDNQNIQQTSFIGPQNYIRTAKQQIIALINYFIEFLQLGNRVLLGDLQYFKMNCNCGRALVFWLDSESNFSKSQNITTNYMNLITKQLSKSLFNQQHRQKYSYMHNLIITEIKCNSSQDIITQLIRSKSIIKSLKVEEVYQQNSKKKSAILQRFSQKRQRPKNRLYYTEIHSQTVQTQQSWAGSINSQQMLKNSGSDFNINKTNLFRSKLDHNLNGVSGQQMHVDKNIKKIGSKRKSLCLSSINKSKKKTEGMPSNRPAPAQVYQTKNKLNIFRFQQNNENYIIDQLTRSKQSIFTELVPVNKLFADVATVSTKQNIKQIYQQLTLQVAIQNSQHQLLYNQQDKTTATKNMKIEQQSDISNNNQSKKLQYQYQQYKLDQQIHNIKHTVAEQVINGLRQQLNRDINPIGEQMPGIRKMLHQRGYKSQLQLYLLSKQFLYLRTSFCQMICSDDRIIRFPGLPNRQKWQQVKSDPVFITYLEQLDKQNICILRGVQQIHDKLTNRYNNNGTKTDFDLRILQIMHEDDKQYTQYIKQLAIKNISKYQKLQAEVVSGNNKSLINIAYRYGLIIILAIKSELPIPQSHILQLRIAECIQLSKQAKQSDILKQLALLQQMRNIFCM